LTYSDRLSATTPPPETLKEPVIQEVNATAPVKTPAAEPPPPAAKIAPPAVKTPPAVAKTAPPAAKTSKPAASDAAGGFVVQVTAVKERVEADTIAKRLASKGFPSFVTSPSAGA